jgi:hypothetical protein
VILEPATPASAPGFDFSVSAIHKRAPRPFAPLFYAKGRDFHETSLSFFFMVFVAGFPTGPGG